MTWVTFVAVMGSPDREHETARDAAAIERTILALAAPPPAELRAFLSEGRPRVVRKGEYFCAPGEREHPLGFVHEGLLRYHVLTERGEDVTKDFAVPGAFCASFGSALQGAPAAVALTALEDTRLTVWSFARARAQFDGHAEWQRFGRRVAEFLYLRKEQRELDLLRLSAAERYVAARRELGPVFGQIPRDSLASYLGIAPESLSRLRSRLARTGRGGA